MKQVCFFFLIGALMISVLPAAANPVLVEWEDTRQDPLFLPSEQMEELGDFVFPPDELIQSAQIPWEGHIPCPANYEGGGAVQVQMTNLTPFNFTDVHYVADPETFLTNDDGLIGNLGWADMTLAFRIDWLGVNTPLVFESVIQDNIFQAGETWEFVIQDYINLLGGPPAPFDSLGIAGASQGFPPSTGSIIAIPEPSSIAMLGIVSGLGLVIRRRFLI